MSGIAEIVGPIAMWVVIGGVAAGVLYFIYRKLIGGAIAKDDLGEAADAREEERDARNVIRSRTDRLRAAWRNVRNGQNR